MTRRGRIDGNVLLAHWTLPGRGSTVELRAWFVWSDLFSLPGVATCVNSKNDM